MRKITKIIIHSSATPEGRHHTAADITHWHKAKGYRTIGYHFIILLDGTIQQGRPISEAGAHTLGQNKHSIGICYIGGCDKNMNPKDTRTPAQKNTLLKLISRLRAEHPSATVHTHNEFAPTACPSFNYFEK